MTDTWLRFLQKNRNEKHAHFGSLFGGASSKARLNRLSLLEGVGPDAPGPNWPALVVENLDRVIRGELELVRRELDGLFFHGGERMVPGVGPAVDHDGDHMRRVVDVLDVVEAQIDERERIAHEEPYPTRSVRLDAPRVPRDVRYANREVVLPPQRRANQLWGRFHGCSCWLGEEQCGKYQAQQHEVLLHNGLLQPPRLRTEKDSHFGSQLHWQSFKRANGPDDFSERVRRARAVRGDPLLGVRRAELGLGGRRHAVHVLGAWADEHVRHLDRRTVLRTEALEKRPLPQHPGDPSLLKLLLLTSVEEQLEGSLVLRDDAKAGGLAADGVHRFERAGDSDRLWITRVERGRYPANRLLDDHPRGDQVVANALAVVDEYERPGRRVRGGVRPRVYHGARVSCRVALVRTLYVEAIEARDSLHRLLAPAHGLRENCHRPVGIAGERQVHAAG